jgi:hypothetical protein
MGFRGRRQRCPQSRHQRRSSRQAEVWRWERGWWLSWWLARPEAWQQRRHSAEKREAPPRGQAIRVAAAAIVGVAATVAILAVVVAVVAGERKCGR